MIGSSPKLLGYEPRPAFAKHADPAVAGCEGKRIGILVVTYNAISTLVPVLKRIPPHVWDNVEEVVVFDDASQDNTFELAVGLKAVCDLPKLHVLKHPKNLGYGGNQKAGYRYFIKKGFDAVVLLHGDGQYAPEILAQLYHPLVAGKADAVFGSRMMKDFGGPLKGGMPLYKFAGNRILTILENRALGLELTEFHSGYRAYNLHALAQLDFSRMTNDFHFDTEIIVKLHHQGMTIREVPIPTYYGTELCNVDGLKYARDVVRSVWRYRRTCRSAMQAPEFAEYFVHHSDEDSKYSARYLARQLVGSKQEVLEIGDASGVAAELERDGNRVTNVDCLPEIPGHVTANSFDRILVLDALERALEPRQLLDALRPALKPNGRMVVSVPNVANIAVRLALLFGSFNDSDRGVLDRRQLHYYTRRTARALLEDNGWEIVSSKAAIVPLERKLGVRASNPIMRALNGLLSAIASALPGLFAYRFVYMARPRA